MPLGAPRHWQNRNVIAYLCLPVALLYLVITTARRWCYRCGLLAGYRAKVPVVIVGNITAGGAGKTPLVIALVEHLKQKRLSVGVVSGGYGGSRRGGPAFSVTAYSNPAEAGDEPVLIAQRTGIPVVVARKRVLAVQQLEDSCDVIVCDDGLQHHALQRDIEIAVVDSGTLFGNRFILPAGPLREPVRRLRTVDIVVHSGVRRQQPGYELSPGALVNLKTGTEIALRQLNNKQVHAVAAIAYPEKFFSLLESFGLIVNRHHFADHHAFTATDLTFNDNHPVLMTEKDRVKCQQYADDRMWCLPVHAVVDSAIMNAFDDLLTSKEVLPPRD